MSIQALMSAENRFQIFLGQQPSSVDIYTGLKEHFTRCIPPEMGVILPRKASKIHHQISAYALMIVDSGKTLGTSMVLDVCKLSLRNPALRERRGVPTEAYK